MSARVVLLSPIDNSAYSRVVLGRLVQRAGVEVAGVAVRRILNPARLRAELRRDGPRLVRKVWKKLVLGGDDVDTAGETGFFELAREEGVAKESVSSLARRHGIPCVRCRDHNDAAVLELLERVRPDCVAFTGGGILRRALLEGAGQGVFNAHMGVLPPYRGMDVVEWPLVERAHDDPGLGVTLHLMARGIDTGPIAMVEPVPIRPGDTIERLRKRFEPVMADLMVRGVEAVRDGALSLREQRLEEGRQYFVMHPRFYEVAGRRLGEVAGGG